MVVTLHLCLRRGHREGDLDARVEGGSWWVEGGEVGGCVEGEAVRLGGQEGVSWGEESREAAVGVGLAGEGTVAG